MEVNALPGLITPRRRKWLIAAASAIILFWLILPAIVEWYIEANSKDMIGRKIEMVDLDFNIITGGIALEEFRFFERNDSAIFFQAEVIYINLEWWEMIFGTFGLNEFRLEKPEVNITQRGSSFNFDDLIARFAADTTQQEPEPEEPVSYRVEDIRLTDGTFTYREENLEAEIKLIQINSSCPLISSKDSLISEQFDFLFDKGGTMKGTFLFNNKTLAYRTDYALDSMNLGIFLPYIAAFMKVGKLEGSLSSHQQIAGNLNQPAAVATTGTASVNKFSLTDPTSASLASLDELMVDIDSIDIGADIYDMRYVKLTRPYLIVELFQEGNNFSRLMYEYEPDAKSTLSSDSLSKAGSSGNIFALMATSIRELSRQYTFSQYKADSLVLRNGTLVFNDFTLNNRFNYLLENLMIKADNVSSTDSAIQVDASSVMNTSGILTGMLRVNPRGFNDIAIDYSITGLRISDFNPYSDFYVAHPFDGVCFYVSKSTVKKQILNSSHVLDIKQIKVGKKVKNKTAYKVPVRLAVALLRDKNGNIHLELPIEGDLADPKFKIGRMIWQIFGNLISKAVASPGRLLAGKAGVQEELLQGFTWKPLQVALEKPQIESLDALAKSLEATPEIMVDLVRRFNNQLESDEVAVREAKKKYLFHHKRTSSDDPSNQDELDQILTVHRTDSAFTRYLDQQVSSQGELVSVYEKSKRLIGEQRYQAKLTEVYRLRAQAVMQYLTVDKKLPPERFRILDSQSTQKMLYADESAVTFRFYADEDDIEPEK